MIVFFVIAIIVVLVFCPFCFNLNEKECSFEKKLTYEYYREYELNDNEKVLYDKVLENALNQKYKFKISDRKWINKDTLNKLNEAIEMDHPEIFWFGGVSSNSFYDTIWIYHSYEYDDIVKTQELIDEVCLPIIKEAKKLETDLEKVEYVKSALQNSASYVMDNKFEEFTKIMGGYYKEFKYIMDELNIKSISKCIIIDRYKIQYYNIVLIDNMWYDVSETTSEVKNVDININNLEFTSLPSN